LHFLVSEPFQDIIQKQIESHANFALKTEYSKEKYRKRKEAKCVPSPLPSLRPSDSPAHRYAKTFTTIEPTTFNVCEFWFAKDQLRIRDIRADSLGQILNLANIYPGGKYLIIDDASGLIASAILERLGGGPASHITRPCPSDIALLGDGRLLAITDTESPPAFPVMQYMNFTSDLSKPLTSLNWATSLKGHNPSTCLDTPHFLTQTVSWQLCPPPTWLPAKYVQRGKSRG
jgi:tRNA (adenine-N(1)-)-methyltransferase non-catalytic subunit